MKELGIACLPVSPEGNSPQPFQRNFNKNQTLSAQLLSECQKHAFSHVLIAKMVRFFLLSSAFDFFLSPWKEIQKPIVAEAQVFES